MIIYKGVELEPDLTWEDVRHLNTEVLEYILELKFDIIKRGEHTLYKHKTLDFEVRTQQKDRFAKNNAICARLYELSQKPIDEIDYEKIHRNLNAYRYDNN